MENFSSCLPAKPLVTFDQQQPQASVLNYNLPATTTFRVRCFVPVEVPSQYWNKYAKTLPSETPHGPLTKSPDDDVPDKEVSGSYLGILNIQVEKARPKYSIPPDDPIDEDPAVIVEAIIKDIATRSPMLQILGTIPFAADYNAAYAKQPVLHVKKQLIMQNLVTPSNNSGMNLRYNAVELAENLTRAKLPVISGSLYGRPCIRGYVSAKTMASPKLYVIEEYEITSFLGDYGAGRTIKTFSLLPGEKTTISIKSWRSNKTTKSRTENVLDSWSEASSDELERMIENEHNSSQQDNGSISASFSKSHTQGSQDSDSSGGSLSISVPSVGGFGFGGSSSGSSTTTDSNSSNVTGNSSRANTVSNLKKGMDRHVQQSSASRKTEVNTETQETASEETGNEETITRELQNINHSRVLNFVFRQLTQEYLTITHLKDVSFGFTKGVLGDGVVTKLDGLDGFLATVFNNKSQVVDIRNKILEELSGVYDFEGTPQAFVERVTEKFETVTEPAKEITRTYFRKKASLKQSWRGKEVEGVILDVAQRILYTDALIVEALLGQGEALDCYNMRLQDAAARKADLTNQQQEDALALLKAITDPTERANAYDKIFNTTQDGGTTINIDKKNI